MKKILFFILSTVLVMCSYSQSWQSVAGKQRFSGYLGIPTKDTMDGSIADSSQILLRSLDSSIWYKYKKVWKKIGGGINASDTAAMLSKYARKVYVDSAINASVPILDLQDVTDNDSVTTHEIQSSSLKLTGVRGSGHLHFKQQTLTPTNVSGYSTLYSYSNGRLKYNNSSTLFDLLTDADTASMLTKYLRKIDTTAMLNPYLRSVTATGTYATISNLALKNNISDTASMLNPYLRKVDTSTLSSRINLKMNISDTATMLSKYLRKTDTATLSSRIDAKQSSFTGTGLTYSTTGTISYKSFIDSPQHTYTGTITFTATTAPSGATEHSYMWTKLGSLVTLSMKLNYATQGSAVTKVILDIPSDMPVPRSPGTTYNASSTNLWYQGVANESNTIAGISGYIQCFIVRGTATGTNAQKIQVSHSSDVASKYTIQIQYFTDN